MLADGYKLAEGCGGTLLVLQLLYEPRIISRLIEVIVFLRFLHPKVGIRHILAVNINILIDTSKM